MEPSADVGLIGLGVMGRNLALNIDDHGFTVAVFNRTTERVDEFLADEAAGTRVIGTRRPEELVAALRSPRRLMLMVKAGSAVDAVIDQLLPLLEPGDIIIDGGNSLYTDSTRRTRRLEEAGMHFVGAGISGGLDGARHGPSIMPGGSEAAWQHVRPVLQGIAAVAEDGTPCCDWIGPDGAGHLVKTVHNGIEYADMELIAEGYDLLHRGGAIPTTELQPIFRDWNQGKLNSFLLGITAEIVGRVGSDGVPLLERIRDAAEEKGTGRWAVGASMESAAATSVIAEAVYARMVSALVAQRQRAAVATGSRTEHPPPTPSQARTLTPGEELIADLHDALYASKIVAYAQGFMLLASASEANGWALDLARIAGLWRAGCIIRARLLDHITAAFSRERGLPNLLLDPFFVDELRAAEPGWRRTVVRAVQAGIPIPAMAAALSFADAYRSERLPAALIQAQRDYFGAHAYERLDRPGGTYFHTDWAGSGATVEIEA